MSIFNLCVVKHIFSFIEWHIAQYFVSISYDCLLYKIIILTTFVCFVDWHLLYITINIISGIFPFKDQTDWFKNPNSFFDFL